MTKHLYLILMDFSAFNSHITIWSGLKRSLHGPWTVCVSTILGVLLIVLPLAISIGLFTAHIKNDAGPLLIMIVAAGVWVIYSGLRQSIEAMRLMSFATSNGFIFNDDSLATNRYNGMLFKQGVVRTPATIRTPDGLFEVGNYKTIGYGSITRGFVRLNLPRPYVHMLLVPASYRLGVPGDINPNQHLSLEGNFDHSYKLYVPKDHERDALYIFTPDVMEQFIFAGNDMMCEVIDDQLYIYAQKAFKLVDAHLYTQIYQKLAIIMPKFNQQLSRYIGNPLEQAHKQTAKLRSGLGLSDYILIALLIAGMLFMVVNGVLHNVMLIAILLHVPPAVSLFIGFLYLACIRRRTVKLS